jgi:hypothetical protein
MAALLADPAAGQGCDDALERLAVDRETGYRLRDSKKGDSRCEGEYKQPIAAPLIRELVPLSFVLVSRPFDPAQDALIRVAWPASSEPLRLRACHVDANVFYRMDHTREAPADRPPPPNFFLWETDVLRDLKLESSKILLLCEALPDAKAPAWARVILPVAVNPQVPASPPAGNDANVSLVLRTNHQIRDLEAQVHPVAGGQGGSIRLVTKDATVAAGGLVRAVVTLPLEGGVFEVRLSYRIRTARGWNTVADTTRVKVQAPSREFAAANG